MNMVTRTSGPRKCSAPCATSSARQAVLIGADVPARNCNDWSASLPQTPLAVIRPVDAAGVREAIAACRQAGCRSCRRAD